MKTVTRPSTNYPPGTRSFDIPPNVQRKFIGADCSFTRENWPAGVPYTSPDGVTYQDIALVVRLESSMDGVIWQQQFDVPFVGGVRIVRGSPLLASTCRFTFTGERDGDLRFTVINTVTLRTAITVQMLEPGD